ncbi:hypothetical protein [Thrips tabaci associated dsRNA virus 2]|uniref:Uncharacterized protein n=1 Tax=Thrips tabaci associated dsRNA virus 2 TaxID=2771480 RepID=A0A7H1D333_9VIRU|nr:hypothetical protein [Thrips tabaci associated dsRNA virus 2]
MMEANHAPPVLVKLANGSIEWRPLSEAYQLVTHGGVLLQVPETLEVEAAAMGLRPEWPPAIAERAPEWLPRNQSGPGQLGLEVRGEAPGARSAPGTAPVPYGTTADAAPYIADLGMRCISGADDMSRLAGGAYAPPRHSMLGAAGDTGESALGRNPLLWMPPRGGPAGDQAPPNLGGAQPAGAGWAPGLGSGAPGVPRAQMPQRQVRPTFAPTHLSPAPNQRPPLRHSVPRAQRAGGGGSSQQWPKTGSPSLDEVPAGSLFQMPSQDNPWHLHPTRVSSNCGPGLPMRPDLAYWHQRGVTPGWTLVQQADGTIVQVPLPLAHLGAEMSGTRVQSPLTQNQEEAMQNLTLQQQNEQAPPPGTDNNPETTNPDPCNPEKGQEETDQEGKKKPKMDSAFLRDQKMKLARLTGNNPLMAKPPSEEDRKGVRKLGGKDLLQTSRTETSTSQVTAPPATPGHPSSQPSRQQQGAASGSGGPTATARSATRDACATTASSAAASSSDDKEVKVGKHSVHSTGLAENPMPLTGVMPGSPDFFRKFKANVELQPSGVDFVGGVDGGFRLTSTVQGSAAGGILGEPVQQQAVVLPVAPEPIPANDAQVRFTAPQVLGPIDPAFVAEFMPAGMTDIKKLDQFLTGPLNVRNRGVATAIATAVIADQTYHDMSAAYAKMMYIAFVIELAAEANAPLIRGPGAIGQHAAVINIADDHLDEAEIADAVGVGRMTFVRGRDNVAADDQMLAYLATPGVPLVNAGNADPHAAHVNWPAVEVTLLKRDDAPVVHVQALPTAATIYEWCSRVARQRGETPDMLKGAYLAAEIAGVRFVPQADGPVAAQRHRHMQADMSLCSYSLPRPNDTCLLVRTLGQQDAPEPVTASEIQALLSLTAQQRVHAFVHLAAMLNIATATMLHSVNITKAMLADWCHRRGNMGGPEFMNVGSGAFFCNTKQGCHDMQGHVRRAVLLWWGYSLPLLSFSDARWLPVLGGNGHADQIWGGMTNNNAPRLYTPLIMNNWTLTRPQEWGLCAPRPTVDFRQEIIDRGRQAELGWWCRMGTNEWEKRIKGKMPCNLVLYSALAVNAICQVLQLNEPVLHRETYQWSVIGGSGRWGQVEPVPQDELEYNVNLRVFTPGCLRTYDWITNTLYSVGILAANLIQGGLQILKHGSPTMTDMIGLLLGEASAPIQGALGAQGFLFDFSSGFG